MEPEGASLAFINANVTSTYTSTSYIVFESFERQSKPNSFLGHIWCARILPREASL